MSTKTIMGALCVVLLATGAFAGEEQGETIRGTVDDFVAATATDEYRVELRADGDLGEAPEDVAETEAVEPVAEMEAPSAPSAWKFDVMLYIWAPAIRGTTAVGLVEQDFSAGFSDITDFLNIGIFARFEAWHGEFGGILEFQYMDLEAWAETEGPLRNREAKIEFRLGMADILGSWKFGDWDIGEARDEGYPKATLELIAGVRVMYLKQQILLENVDLGDDSTWADLMVGTRFTYGFTRDVMFVLSGKVGGFGLGNSSDSNWDALIGFNIKLSDAFDLRFGYKVGGLDYDSGDTGRDTFSLDIFMHGGYLGLAYLF